MAAVVKKKVPDFFLNLPRLVGESMKAYVLLRVSIFNSFFCNSSLMCQITQLKALRGTNKLGVGHVMPAELTL